MTTSTPSKLLLLAAAVTAGLALAQGMGGDQGLGPHHGPPPEAVQACASLEGGTACGFTMNGQNLIGTCVTRRDGSGLVCHPAGMGPGGQCHGGCRGDAGVCPGECGGPHGGYGGMGGPPPAALAACEGKTASTACRFAAPDGKNIDGTCLNRPRTGELVCHPKDAPMGITRQGPPLEALKACEGKASGAACSFSPPHGGTLSGTCFSPSTDKPLACRP